MILDVTARRLNRTPIVAIGGRLGCGHGRAADATATGAAGRAFGPQGVRPERGQGAFVPNRLRQKAGLNRGILASCWGLLANRTEQKAADSGAVVIYVDLSTPPSNAASAATSHFSVMGPLSRPAVR